MNATYDGPRLALDFDALAHNWRQPHSRSGVLRPWLTSTAML